jgi:hypothetical protein
VFGISLNSARKINIHYMNGAVSESRGLAGTVMRVNEGQPFMGLGATIALDGRCLGQRPEGRTLVARSWAAEQHFAALCLSVFGQSATS